MQRPATGYCETVPELPDVEGFRQVLADHAVGRRIQAVDVLDAGVLRGVTGPDLHRALAGHQFRPPWRHGKHLVVPLTPSRRQAAILLHFGMTGSLHWATDANRHRFDRVVFRFAEGELRLRDMRKLHGLRYAPDQAAIDRVLDKLGPDAADLTAPELRDRLADRRGQVKPVLMDQSVVAGLGNLLVDEILWRARINPRRACTQLDADDVRRLHARMRTVLRQSVRAGRVPPRATWLTGRRDDPSGSCPRCGTTLSHTRIGGRGTTWCGHCQAR
ncbi:formamidopyrimidine-DNA glycosylase [Kribbella sp. VKM Ac-2571]|uniref:Fpg/Nei family DNA glycosylase n=1 Tax=Kribbella sp. VKM Ac-2571 TaxID=2512222 RepID=UPI0010E9B310|nr:DNA-formamidopyrimidine glycosylase family protein [Kribbella sp. VKM Ac-2571]TDO51151.1 formamidopyrimidine-DNA glycosylase [Kribbella sp. VKM Ac-2571]